MVVDHDFRRGVERLKETIDRPFYPHVGIHQLRKPQPNGQPSTSPLSPIDPFRLNIISVDFLEVFKENLPFVVRQFPSPLFPEKIVGHSPCVVNVGGDGFRPVEDLDITVKFLGDGVNLPDDPRPFG